MPKRERWPRLSQTLLGPVAPDYCQSCARNGGEVEQLTRWIECGDDDKPDLDDPVVLVLCDECSEKLIEKHPRLYTKIADNAPQPGTMRLCISCTFRKKVACSHPSQKKYGGSGLIVNYFQPMRVHFQTIRKGGGRSGYFENIYAKPPTECQGREAREGEPPLLTRSGQLYFDAGFSTEPDESEADETKLREVSEAEAKR